MARSGRIDVHFHLIPQFYADMVYAAGSGPAIGRYPDWSPELALEVMDRFDIETALLSLGQPGVQFCKPRRGQDAGAALQRLFRRAQRQTRQALRRVRHGVDVEHRPTRSRRSAIASTR